MLADESNDELVTEIAQLTLVEAKRLISELNPGTSMDQIITILSKAVMEGLGTDEWSGYPGYQSLLKNGVYSPLQLLLCNSATQPDSSPDRDYPFLFGTIGCLLSQLTNPSYVLDGATKDRYRRMLQTLFQMREMKEEGENLSIEAYLPESINHSDRDHEHDLEIKKLAQIFGRGSGVVAADDFPKRIKVKGNVFDIFKSYDGTSSALLYSLGQVYSHIPSKNISVAIKRDRNVILSTKYNPLLEFYDGGWHIVDLESGRAAIEGCLEFYPELNTKAKESGVTEPLLSLAYYMASHWHSGILALIDCKKAEDDGVLEEQKGWSKDSTKIILNQLEKEKTSSFRITELRRTKMGRVLLTNAIQDGATMFEADGKFHSAGRIVSNFSREGRPSDEKSGTGNRAALRLAEYGIALKISKDGAIKLYSSRPEGVKQLNGGLRIR